MRIPHVKFLVAGAAIIGTICFLMFSGINDSMVYYYTVSEVQAQGADLQSRGVRVSGLVSPGSIQRTGGASVDFVVFEKNTEKRMPVSYQGIIPDTFKDGAEVVVEGTYDADSDSFQAYTLLAKCPSKYEAQGEQHPAEIPQGKSGQQ